MSLATTLCKVIVLNEYLSGLGMSDSFMPTVKTEKVKLKLEIVALYSFIGGLCFVQRKEN